MSDKDDVQSRDAPAPRSRTPRFGAMLRAMRESYLDRMGRQTPSGAPTPRMRLSALALIKCLEDAGYPLSSGAYSEIESGNNFPRDGRKFLKAVGTCLSLSEVEERALREALAYDLVAPKLGDLAEYVVRHSSSLGDALRSQRKRAGYSAGRLAQCLVAHRFTPPDMDTDEIAELIIDLEQGEQWPLGDEWRTRFVVACAQCLGREARQELETGMVDDFHTSMASTLDSSLQPQSEKSAERKPQA